MTNATIIVEEIIRNTEYDEDGYRNQTNEQTNKTEQEIEIFNSQICRRCTILSFTDVNLSNSQNIHYYNIIL